MRFGHLAFRAKQCFTAFLSGDHNGPEWKIVTNLQGHPVKLSNGDVTTERYYVKRVWNGEPQTRAVTQKDWDSNKEKQTDRAW